MALTRKRAGPGSPASGRLRDQTEAPESSIGLALRLTCFDALAAIASSCELVDGSFDAANIRSRALL